MKSKVNLPPPAGYVQVGTSLSGYPIIQDPGYQKGEPLTARVYTIEDESRYLNVSNVPALALSMELKAFLCSQLQATPDIIHSLTYLEPDTKDATSTPSDSFLVCFLSVHHAKHVKQRCDGLRWYGATLSVSYAPQHETAEDLRDKYLWRRRWIR